VFDPAPAPAEPAAPAAPEPAQDGAGEWRWPWVAALAVALGAAAAVRTRRRAAPGSEAVWAALAEARQAALEGRTDAESRALARALRAALAPHVSGADPLAAEQLAGRPLAPPLDAAVRMLAAVERARFDPEAPPPDRARVERVVEELRSRRR
jgi:hypothetical protein